MASKKLISEKPVNVNRGHSITNKMNYLLLFRSLEKELGMYVDHSKSKMEILKPGDKMFVRKRLMSQHLENLEQEDLECAMRIIEDNLLILDLPSNEITMDSLDEPTLILLEEFIEKVNLEKSKKHENEIIDLLTDDEKGI